jgi:hypothetical protein
MKVVARELIWIFIALVLSAPVAYLFGNTLELRPEQEILSKTEEVFEMELYLIGGIIGFI